MSHTEFLHELRKFELEVTLHLFSDFFGKPGARILEVGAGTGYQAKSLNDLGYAVVAVDVASSHYRDDRVFPVIDYDGENIPAASNSFEIAFSSNVLEHVAALAPLLKELRRVVVADGFGIHIMPTSSWRFWTILTHYVWLVKRLWALFFWRRPVSSNSQSTRPVLPNTFAGLIGTFFPLRHGERGVTLTEMYFYSKRWWIRQFEANGYKVIAAVPTGLFYTGSFALGPKLSIARRRWLARFLGSSCRTYIVAAQDMNVTKAGPRDGASASPKVI